MELNGTGAAPVVSVTLQVNGERRSLSVDVRTTLLDALREHLSLKGSKKGCDHGQCGACTVIVNDRRINSCLSLAVMDVGVHVSTVDGSGMPDTLPPLQVSFLDHYAIQCGYNKTCQICSATAVLDKN